MALNGFSAQHVPLPGLPLARPGPAGSLASLPTGSVGPRVLDLAGPDPPQEPLFSITAEREKLEKLRTRLDSLTTGNEGIRKPKGFKTKLKPHQMEALKWMVAKEKEVPSGGILADDMGLGKTASMIALIMKSKEKTFAPAAMSTDGSGSSDDEDEERSGGKPKGGTLIICPLTLIDHWEHEVMTHVKKGLSVARHHGPTRRTDPEKLAKLNDVVITTYGVVRQEANKGPLFKMSWERVILDEAHEVRNPESLGCKTVSSLEADHRWCVTGTPIHNSLLDLHALYKFLNWAPFSDRETWEAFFGVGDLRDARLWELLKSVSVKRRTKREYGDGGSVALPLREVVHVIVDMDINERHTYDEVAKIMSRLATEVPAGQDPNKSKKKGMYGILMLRQMCNHPSLLKEEQGCINEDLDLDEPTTVNDAKEDLEADGGRNKNFLQIQDEWNGTKRDLQNYMDTDQCSNEFFSRSRPSTKMEKLLEILREVLALNDKAVIVSQWTKMLELVSTSLKQHNISHATISGDVPSPDRPKVVSDFNNPSDPLKVLLLSLKAGGVGLNLVGGNHLILFDPHWNPQLEAQACDRVYRMGQMKPKVTIYKFVVRDSIEEVILEKQKEKLSLAETVLDNPSVRNIRKMTHFDEDEDAVARILHYEARRCNKRKALE
ncbi:transcription termination factor 2-like [Thrips palmi]|uniref:Transcription termination factor 2-like n=1 Tax=Thrips palmi TaxID=161013 RepID=A0A6P8YD91_THRPL|nr:transcription termination factor 2-like [Thrips palmi]XP_034231757.1 transcription termination factor 2-like [Thrips palmi]